MSKKSGLQRTGDMARHARQLRKSSRAALRGGWQAATLEAVKHYWPYILTAAIVLLMLPIIVFHLSAVYAVWLWRFQDGCHCLCRKRTV